MPTNFYDDMENLELIAEYTDDRGCFSYRILDGTTEIFFRSVTFTDDFGSRSEIERGFDTEYNILREDRDIYLYDAFGNLLKRTSECYEDNELTYSSSSHKTVTYDPVNGYPVEIISYYGEDPNPSGRVVYSDFVSGISAVSASDDANAPVEFYNLQGIRIANPENGICIRRQGAKATKVLIK
ncbi:MAG: hypothetical protein NC336_00220 [Clostridium sp.]|nr:hypothetical protein [Clostridium sp.]